MKKVIICITLVLLLGSTLGGAIHTPIELQDNHDVETPSDGPMDSAWPMFGYNAQHTGRSPYNTTTNLGGLKWKFETDWMVESSPIIDNNNTIYVSSWNYLFAVNPNGTEKWRWRHDELYGCSPALAKDGTIYIGTNSGRLFGLYPNGTVKWEFIGGGRIVCPLTIGDNGVIYYNTFDENGKFFAINPNGTEKWHYDADFYCEESPAIAEDGTIYFNSHVYLYAFYPNGTLIWKRKLGDLNFTFLGGPSVGDDGIIYIPCDPSYLYAIYPNGTVKWKSSTVWGSRATPSIGSDGTIYIGYKHMFAFYPNGTRKWVFKPDEDDYHNIESRTYSISADGTIYIGTRRDSQNCFLIALNPDGTEKWRQRIANEHALSSPIIGDDGTVYIGAYMNDGGILYAFNDKKFESPVIEKPKFKKLYFLNKELKSTFFDHTVIIGQITIEVTHPDSANISKIEFYIDNEKVHEDVTAPYEWTWKNRVFGEHIIRAIAVNMTGNTRSSNIKVWKFF